MGSLISRIVFMPPTKHPEHDAENPIFLNTSHKRQIQVLTINKDENGLYLFFPNGLKAWNYFYFYFPNYLKA